MALFSDCTQKDLGLLDSLKLWRAETAYDIVDLGLEHGLERFSWASREWSTLCTTSKHDPQCSAAMEWTLCGVALNRCLGATKGCSLAALWALEKPQQSAALLFLCPGFIRLTT